jgi:Holliday junction resolvasome RuvABC endonuclease subunit
MKLRVLCIDPSLRNWGFAKIIIDSDKTDIEIDSLKLVKTESDKKNAKVVRKNSDDLERAKLIYGALHREIVEYVPDFVFVEVPVGSQSARAMASYGICIGVLASIGVPLIQVTPTEVKLAGHGTKTASKEEMIAWAVKKHPNANWLKHGGKLVAANEHLADAVAVGYAGMNSTQFLQALAAAQSFLNRVN